jgi:hypothetical protein
MDCVIFPGVFFVNTPGDRDDTFGMPNGKCDLDRALILDWPWGVSVGDLNADGTKDRVAAKSGRVIPRA